MPREKCDDCIRSIMNDKRSMGKGTNPYETKTASYDQRQ